MDWFLHDWNLRYKNLKEIFTEVIKKYFTESLGHDRFPDCLE